VNGRMHAEMAEQPAVLDALLRRAPAVAATVRAAVPSPLLGIDLIAHGSSRNAALFARHVLEAATRRPVSLAALSLLDGDAAPDVDRRGRLAIAVSQSGCTTDVVAAVQRVQQQGARTLAIVNDAHSALAAAADMVIDIQAGPEQAVPATKTFTASLLCLALAAEALGRPPWERDALAPLPAVIRRMLVGEAAARRVAERLDVAHHLLVAARGPLLAAACETALKVREAAGVVAEAISAEELRHGWLGGLHRGGALLLIAPARDDADMVALQSDARRRGALVLVASTAAESDLPLPAGLPGPLLAFPAAVRGQQLALALARRRHVDADAPEGLAKITLSA
jgi:glutamine---fructose-6-phosphate transaminase (isomerizing)